ncbi:MAG: hypothetical protein FWG01_04135 [Betaproteobacteria bacterium]|nr:hypothetical protein [Betaproteobacteria bacterium]
MSNTTMWGPKEDDDYLATSAQRAMFDMREQWGNDNDPHPVTQFFQKTAGILPQVFSRPEPLTEPMGTIQYAAPKTTLTQKINQQEFISNTDK